MQKCTWIEPFPHGVHGHWLGHRMINTATRWIVTVTSQNLWPTISSRTPHYFLSCWESWWLRVHSFSKECPLPMRTALLKVTAPSQGSLPLMTSQCGIINSYCLCPTVGWLCCTISAPQLLRLLMVWLWLYHGPAFLCAQYFLHFFQILILIVLSNNFLHNNPCFRICYLGNSIWDRSYWKWDLRKWPLN